MGSVLAMTPVDESMPRAQLDPTQPEAKQVSAEDADITLPAVPRPGRHGPKAKVIASACVLVDGNAVVN